MSLTARDNTLVVASRARVDSALFEAADAPAPRCSGRVTRIGPGRPHRIVVGGRGHRRGVRDRGRRREQPRSSDCCVHSGVRTVCRNRLLRTRHQRRCIVLKWSTALGLHLVFPQRPPGDRHLAQAARPWVRFVMRYRWMTRTGISRGATLEPSWPILTRPPTSRASNSPVTAGSRSATRQARRPDCARRDLLRRPVCAVRGRRDRAGIAAAARCTPCAKSSRTHARATQGGVLQAAMPRLLIDALSSSANRADGRLVAGAAMRALRRG